MSNQERFIVKPAAEMREGEPCRRYYTEAANAHAKDMNEEHARSEFYKWGKVWEPHGISGPYLYAIVDTHSPEWQAFDARHRAFGEPETVPALPEIAKPRGPTDAEIVAAYECFIASSDRGVSRAGGIWIMGTSVSMAECSAAWSRELKRKQAESREHDRHRVICQGTEPGEHEFNAP